MTAGADHTSVALVAVTEMLTVAAETEPGGRLRVETSMAALGALRSPVAADTATTATCHVEPAVRLVKEPLRGTAPTGTSRVRVAPVAGANAVISLWLIEFV